jgi:hypothetical protein
VANALTLRDDDGDGGLALAGATDVFSDYRVNGEQLVQVAEGIRAPHGKPINRGNVQNKVTLAITHAPAASPGEAQAAATELLVDLAEKLATATLLDIGLGALVFRLHDAALLSYEIHARGTTVFASYNFTGGAITDETPAGP